MSKHTPGPWFTSDTQLGWLDVYQARPATFGDEHVKYITGETICSVESKDKNKEAANAHLIAAAPDLLDACKEVASLDCEDWGTVEWLEWVNRAVDRAKDAAKKATLE